MAGGMAANDRSGKLGEHILNFKHNANRANWRLDDAIASKPTPSDVLPEARQLKGPQTVPPTEDQIP